MLFVVVDANYEAEFGKRHFDDESIFRICAKVKNTLEKLSGGICELQLGTAEIDDYMKNSSEMGAVHRKHLLQHSSIIGKG